MAGEVVSINFWFPPPQWYYGNPESGSISWDSPLFGVKRVLFQRCVEELIAKTCEPSQVYEIVEICAGLRPSPPFESKIHEAVQNVNTFVSTVFSDPMERRALLVEIIEGRF